MTLVYIFVIVTCTICIILFNSVIAKLGRFEVSQKELEFQLKKQSDMQQGTPEEAEAAEVEKAVEAARKSYMDRLSVYNECIDRFPGKIIAQIYGFKAISGEEDDDFE